MPEYELPHVPTIEDGLRGRLLEIGEVTSITTTIRADVLFHPDELPAVLINVQSELRDSDLDGYGGLVHGTIGITCLSKKRWQARMLAKAAKGTAGRGLEAFNGTSGGFSFHVENIPEINFDHQDVGDGSTDMVYIVELICKVGYSEAV